MASLRAVREGLAANLDAIDNLQVSPYMLGNPTPPTAEVVPDETEYDKSFQRGYDYWTVKVRVLVGTPSDQGAQKRLDRFLASSGSESVKAAIEADTTLGGAVEDLRVTKCTGYRVFGREGGAPLLGAEWLLDVWAEGES